MVTNTMRSFVGFSLVVLCVCVGMNGVEFDYDDYSAMALTTIGDSVSLRRNMSRER